MKYYYSFFLILCLAVSNAQVINFTDASLKERLLFSAPSNEIAKDLDGNYFAIDANDDNEIDVAEAAQASALSLNWDTSINDLSSLASFANLKDLDISYCSISNLDISTFSQLETLTDFWGILDVLNLSSTTLKKLSYIDSSITSVSLAGLPALEELNVSSSAVLETVNLTGGTHLKKINISDSDSINSIDLSVATNLEDVVSYGCSGLAIMNVGELPHLKYLSAYYNSFATLDLSGCPNLEWVSCSENENLVALLVKNGANETIDAGQTPNLSYICADESQIASIQAEVPATCEVNSYCSFEPGGNYYTVHGQTKLDLDSNGCGNGDGFYPNLKFTVTDGMESGIFIGDNSGVYILPLQAGIHTVTPVLENNYYNLSTPQFTADFPAAGSEVIQDICITPNGSHNDLEVVIIPLTAARAGFDADYKILVRNTGNTNQSADLVFSFYDNVMDPVFSVPIPDLQNSGSFIWSNINIMPFEKKEYLIRMSLNSPTDIPPLNGLSILQYNASVSTATLDETPANNTMSFEQRVVSSFDPNDKTCLEGDFIPMSDDGQYIHYLIRFENTGTANAQNIVVKDVIDTTYLDPATLTPISSNYSFITRITDNNKVEFIFENINLPFDDANNDGYILFKIKTKPAIALGTTFLNTASIYFDYNFPVVTEPAAVTVSVPLGISDVENKYGFAIYPNPVRDVLNISSKTNANVNTIMIYNTLGQEVMKVIPANGDCSIDVSRLPIGGYVVKLSGEALQWCTKFVKQ